MAAQGAGGAIEQASEPSMPSRESIAVISDIHGNRWALAAVLADIARRRIATVINLGDSLCGRLDPAGTADLLIAAAIPSIAGNQDRVLYEAQPKTLAHGDLLFCHGTPSSDETYLLEQVTPHGVQLADHATILGRLGDTTARVVLCGHSHQPRVVALPGGRLAVNPGSVGLPAYTEDTPYFHVMEAGSPHARYAVLEEREGAWSVEIVATPYAWHEAASTARRNGRADWAEWIETGRG
jgi:predicted phosphodiesterase